MRDEGFWKDITTRTASGILHPGNRAGFASLNGIIPSRISLVLTTSLGGFGLYLWITVWLIIRHQTIENAREEATGVGLQHQRSHSYSACGTPCSSCFGWLGRSSSRGCLCG
jgi:type IV secretory pathway TrbD component